MADTRKMVTGIHPEPLYIGRKNIPENGPMLVTFNHYSRSGFFILWAAVAISAALPCSSLWLMTEAWTNRKGGFDRIRTALTRMIFERLAQIYGLVTTPPMPPSDSDVTRRAVSIRRLIRKVKEKPDTILCIAPEGMDFPGGKLGVPFPGTGRMLLQAANILKRIIPVGVYEEDERMVINFGRVYELEFSKDDKNTDKIVIDQVMKQIAKLLPVDLRGKYE